MQKVVHDLQSLFLFADLSAVNSGVRLSVTLHLVAMSSYLFPTHRVP